jgi:hypothetical protein
MKKMNNSKLPEVEVRKPIYDQAMVLEVLPFMNAATLQTWVNRGFILKRQGVGTGKRRLYSGADICQIMTMRVLTWQGVQVSAAARLGFMVAERCIELAARVGSFGLKNYAIKYFVDKDGIYDVRPLHSDMSAEEMMDPGSYVYGIIEADDIINDLVFRIAALKK